LEQHLITRFGIPIVLVFDNASYFSLLKLVEFSLDKGTVLCYSTKYYLQGDEVSKYTNKNLIQTIKKMVVDHHCNWNNALPDALWIDQAIPKVALGIAPYFLMY